MLFGTIVKDIIYLCLQKPGYSPSFEELQVDEDNVEMSNFVRKNLGVSDFQNAHAFYEFTNEEDLGYYRDVVHLLEKEGKVQIIYFPLLGIFFDEMIMMF